MNHNFNIDVYKKEIDTFCHKWNVKELSVFGSALREDFNPDSDVDVLIDFAPNHGRSLFDLVAMKDELEIIFRREIDLVTMKGIERSRNEIRKKEILNSYQVIYAS